VFYVADGVVDPIPLCHQQATRAGRRRDGGRRRAVEAMARCYCGNETNESGTISSRRRHLVVSSSPPLLSSQTGSRSIEGKTPRRDQGEISGLLQVSPCVDTLSFIVPYAAPHWLLELLRRLRAAHRSGRAALARSPKLKKTKRPGSDGGPSLGVALQSCGCRSHQ
jgi:hypothetical protein